MSPQIYHVINTGMPVMKVWPSHDGNSYSQKGDINPSPPSAAYMHQWTGSSLVQVMACRLFGAKPLPEPIPAYCQLDSWKQISVKFESELYHFHSRKCIWKCRLPKWRPSCPGGNALMLKITRDHETVCLTFLDFLQGVSLDRETFCLSITVTSKWARYRLKSPVSRLFTQPFIQTQIKGNIKAPRHWPLCGEFTGDRWIPRTNGQ